MRIDWRKFGIGLAIAAALLLWLGWNTDLAMIDPMSIRFDLAGLAVAMFLICILCRAASYRILAHRPAGARSADWARLAARHQIVFMIAPSGVGDLGFPLLAGRYTGLPLSAAVNVIALFRLRDAAVLGLLAVAGAILEGLFPVGAWAAILAGAVLVLFVEPLAAQGLHLLRNVLPDGRLANFLAACAAEAGTSLRERALRSALAVLTWIVAGAAVICAFTAAGRPLSLGEAWLMLAALNLVGMLAVTLGGLGIAEVGAAGVLIWFGDSPAEAAATALLARPTLLVSMITAAGLIDLGVSLVGGRRLAPPGADPE